MRFLVVYAHPEAHSFHAAIHDRVVCALRARHEVDDCNLYAEDFQPVLSREERLLYYAEGQNFGNVAKDISRLRRAEGLVFVFPTWWYGMPAILKGYLDRVWLPGVAFEVIDGRTRPLLQNIRIFAVVTTYGSPWWLNRFLFRDPNRRVLMKCIRHLFPGRTKTLWLAQYGMDYVDDTTRKLFLERIERAFSIL